jgi:hypothetical protein
LDWVAGRNVSQGVGKAKRREEGPTSLPLIKAIN